MAIFQLLVLAFPPASTTFPPASMVIWATPSAKRDTGGSVAACQMVKMIVNVSGHHEARWCPRQRGLKVTLW